MRKNIILILLKASLGCSLMTACQEKSDVTTETTTESTEAAESIKATDSETAQNAVATGDETVAPIDVVEEGMTPIDGSMVKDGTYSVTVDSSSSMFNIAECELVVENGVMTATMKMGGTGYKYLYMGTAQEAANTDESEYIDYIENDDETNSFTIPVDALDSGIDCAAFSKKKEKWYDRTLVFRADSLPSDALLIDTSEATAIELDDGEYTIEVTLEGGSGRASIDSPANLTVENGVATAEIVWSSPNYDYMKIDDVQYDPVNTDGNSVFEIPVAGFDYKMQVIADTTAMSTPHEIEYTLYFDSATIIEK